MSTAGPPDRASVVREWTSAAGAWRKWRQEFALQSRAATDLLLEAARVEPGMRILDLASGSGEPAVSLARAAGPKGRVVATDIVPEMLLGAQEHAADRGGGNVVFAAANGEILPFSDGIFDRLTCRFGVMFFPDVENAMAEARRVLRSNGRAVFLAWGEARHNTFFSATTGVLLKHAPPAQQTPDLAHRFAERGSLSAVLRHSFQQVTETFHSIFWTWPGTPEGFWDYSAEVRRSFRRIFESLGPAEQEEAKQESLAEMQRSYDGERVNFSAQIVIATGVRG
ncbi:MAG TPA: class I SAM-dependent methyltransferase [Bryobacteraceae bacterium]|nr:class I SAM-dependent methyltransferase [Bryobacteraceae bacterium]